MAKDLYEILNVPKTASGDEIKRAFRKLAHQYHPDKPGGDEAKFKEINAAYQILSDPQKREQYDQFGPAAFQQGGPGGFGGFDFSGFGGGVNMDDLGDIFGDMFGFGGGRSRKRAARGGDIQVDMELEFSESIFGTEKDVTLTKPSSCARCGGIGAEPGTNMKTCSGCNGSGTKIQAQRTILGTIQTRTTCGDCRGRGEVPERNCAECLGTGVRKQTKTLQVTIPSGVESGSVLRMRGEGEAIPGGESGDLYIQLHVRKDTRFEREGMDIVSKVKIGFSQAALGDKITVETVDGNVELKIPAGIQSGTRLRLKGKGVPTRSGRGDFFVIVDVVTPRKLSREQKRLLDDLGLRE